MNRNTAVLLCILAAAVLLLVIVRTSNHPRSAKRVATIADLQALRGVIKNFQADNHRLPTNIEGLGVLVTCPPDLQQTWKGPYVDRITTDKWGNSYKYTTCTPTTQHDLPFNVISAGEDQTFGTKDDLDIDTEE